MELPVVGGQLPAAKEEKRAGKMPKPQNAPPQPTRRGPRQFGPPPTGPIVEESVAVAVAPPKKPPKPRAKVKIDPQFVAAARELRDRYLEHVNTASPLAPRARYDVSRTLSSTEGSRSIETVERNRLFLPAEMESAA